MRTRKVLWSKVEVNIPGVAFRDYENETAFQIYCADWLRKQAEIFPKNDYWKFWHHSANERFGAKAGFNAKMMGQAKGWPDFVHCGLKLAVELKVLNGKVGPEQTKWLGYFRTIGWRTGVIHSFEEFRDLVLARILEVETNLDREE